jgi:hypothetical protein
MAGLLKSGEPFEIECISIASGNARHLNALNGGCNWDQIKNLARK